MHGTVYGQGMQLEVGQVRTAYPARLKPPPDPWGFHEGWPPPSVHPVGAPSKPGSSGLCSISDLGDPNSGTSTEGRHSLLAGPFSRCFFFFLVKEVVDSSAGRLKKHYLRARKHESRSESSSGEASATCPKHTKFQNDNKTGWDYVPIYICPGGSLTPRG